MSPNYPSTYSSGLALQCYFSLPDKPGESDYQIAFSVLDFKLQGESKSPTAPGVLESWVPTGIFPEGGGKTARTDKNYTNDILWKLS